MNLEENFYKDAAEELARMIDADIIKEVMKLNENALRAMYPIVPVITIEEKIGNLEFFISCSSDEGFLINSMCELIQLKSEKIIKDHCESY